MARRLHADHVRLGLLPLDAGQAHHARRVLRLNDGDAVEVFDEAGRSGDGVIVIVGDDPVGVRVDAVREPAESTFEWTVAAAVPKGERADWMVEKLSELGCHTYVPLLADRSVVTPKGTGKRDRWLRLATESAKQCRRAGVMRVEEPVTLDALLARLGPVGGGEAKGEAWFLHTGPSAASMRSVTSATPPASLTLLIGPEGGWTDGEVGRMGGSGLTAVSLTPTILRIETAAVTAAACVACLWSSASGR